MAVIAGRRADGVWLAGLCLSRFLLALVFTSYAAILPVLQREWQMSAAAAGVVASAFQIGYAISLVSFNLLADRIGARRVFLWSSLAGAPAAMAFAVFADGPLSAALLYGLTALVIGGISLAVAAALCGLVTDPAAASSSSPTHGRASRPAESSV